MKISRRSFMSGLHATFLTTALASIAPSAYAMESPGMDSLDVLVSIFQHPITVQFFGQKNP